MLYLETFGNPERFGRVAHRVSRRKPVLAIRGNRRPEARDTGAQSHTAAALRGDAAIDALFRHAGVMRFRGGDDLFNAAEFFESQPLPHGRRVGIVSNSFGVATLAVDACVTRGLLVGEVGRPVEGVAGPEPDAAVTATANPTTLPIGVSPSEYGDAVRALLSDHGVDAVMAYYVDSFAGEPEAVFDAIAQSVRGAGKPVVASVITADGRLPRDAGRTLPNFVFPESCAAVLARGVQRREWLSRPLGQRPQFDDFDAEGARELACADLHRRDGERSHWMATENAERLLGMYGLPVTPSRLCHEAEEAVRAAGELERPIALKAHFAPPTHASDIDAVLLGLEGEVAVTAGWRELQRRVQAAGWDWCGATVQPLEGPGADLLVGMVRDPDYGPVMALGLGGRQAGLGSDAAVRMLPATDVEADELIDASAAVATRLGPFRGQPALDREALRALLLRFAVLLRDVAQILEVDLNPTRCMQHGCRVLDVRIRVGEAVPREHVKTW
jgi:acyl-CoA synthetase (NDP forming)